MSLVSRYTTQIPLFSKALHNSAFSSVSKDSSERPRRVKPRSIQFFTTCPEAWGGSEELWSGVARRLVGEDFQVTANMSYLDKDHPRIVELIESGVLVEKYRGVPGLWRYPGFGWRWEPAFTIAHLRAKRPDLAVISQGENLDGQRQIRYCRSARVPYVIICQKAMEDEWPMDCDREALKESFVRAKRVFFVSQHNRLVTEERLGQKLPNAEVVWNPFNVDYHPNLRWPGLADGRLRLACVARLWMRDKGQDLLLKVLAQDKWKNRAIEVNLYGSGHNAVGLAELARLMGTERVQFCGFAQNVTEVWRQCHALILPSRHEGLPLALVEAMLCERPAIATDAGGNGEVLDDEVTGFMAHSATVAGVDEALERAWNRRADWQKIGQTAGLMIRKKIPEDPCAVFADRLKSIYRDVVRAR